MPNTQINKSAEKRVRQDKRKRARNRIVKGYTRDVVRLLIAETDPEKAKSMLPHVYSSLDKAVKKGVMHHRTAARRKSRLTSYVNKLGVE
ncbi:MAG: 30S ribosomal protein S20 [bacterium]